jgi:hypothetical protein
MRRQLGFLAQAERERAVRGSGPSTPIEDTIVHSIVNQMRAPETSALISPLLRPGTAPVLASKKARTKAVPRKSKAALEREQLLELRQEFGLSGPPPDYDVAEDGLIAPLHSALPSKPPIPITLPSRAGSVLEGQTSAARQRLQAAAAGGMEALAARPSGLNVEQHRVYLELQKKALARASELSDAELARLRLLEASVLREQAEFVALAQCSDAAAMRTPSELPPQVSIHSRSARASAQASLSSHHVCTVHDDAGMHDHSALGAGADLSADSWEVCRWWRRWQR